MTEILPDFRVNICYRVIKLKKLFSSHAKAKIPQIDMSNLIYQYNCPCTQIYIGQTKRFLKLRAEDHQRPSNGSHVCSHILSCKHHNKKADEYALKFRDKFTILKKARLEFFKTCFSVLEKGFRNDVERRRCEAYHIRLKSPKINDQKDLRAFGLF